jgi:hypothetical protein
VLTALTAATSRGNEIDEATTRWCQNHLDNKIRAATDSVRSTLLPPASLAHHIHEYADAIGDTQQALPGELTRLDPMLTRSGR